MPEAILSPWCPSGAWQGVVPNAGRFGKTTGPAGVTLQPLDHVDLATIIVQENRRPQLADFVSRRFSIALPDTGRAAFGQAGALVWSAPNQWLAVAPDGGDLDDLHEGLEAIASVTDQGDGRALVRISGPAARRTLVKSIAIDLHPSVFDVGSAATTAMAHVSVQLWVESERPAYLVATPRTMAGTIWRCLTAAAAEFGYVVEADPHFGMDV